MQAEVQAATPMDTEPSRGRPDIEEMIIAAILDTILSSNASRRCAACLWLVSLLTYCPGHPRLRDLLLQAQEIFAQLLGDANDLTQV